MKKKKILLFLSLLLIVAFITTGCGKETDLKNGAKVAVSVDSGKFTASEYYDEIKTDNISKLVNMIDKSIFEKILSVKALMEWLKQFDEGEAADKQN